MLTIANPLDHFEALVGESVIQAYQHASYGHRPPTLLEVFVEVPGYFRQELMFRGVVGDNYPTLGAADQEDFIWMVENGEYDNFLPDLHTVKFVLDGFGMTYMERTQVYRIYNDAITGVW